MATSKYLLDTITPLLREGVCAGEHMSFDKLSAAQDKIHKLFVQKDFSLLKKYISELEANYSLDLSKARNYVNMAAAIAVADSNYRPISMDEGTYEGLKARMEGQPRQLITDRELHMSYTECKMLIKNIISECFSNSTQEVPQNRFVFPFVVSENFEAKGEILLKNFDKPQSVALVSIAYYEDSHGEPKMAIRLFGEKVLRRDTSDFVEKFYIYNFVSDSKESFVVFSQTEIPDGHCLLKGMSVGVTDEVKIGSSATTMTNLHVLFATSVQSDIRQLTADEFLEIAKGWGGHDILAEKFFGKLRHPLMFEKLILVWLFSGKFTGFPLHLGWLAQNGTGKSHILEAITRHAFGENRWDATSSTGLSLVPSYGGAQIEPGYLIRQKRVGSIDEFFTGFIRSGRKDQRLGQDTAFMTSILEHQRVPLGSGKHQTVYAQARAKFIFATNPVSKITSMTEAAAELPRQFLSRGLWYVQTKSHVDFITERKALIDRMPVEEKYPKHDDNLLMAYDYLNSFTVDIPLGPDKAIFEKHKELLPDELLQEVYLGRAYHHILCLIDGMSKYNSIVQKRKCISCEPQDIKDAEILFSWVISTWNANVNLLRMPIEIRYEYIPVPGQKVFDVVDANHGLTAYQLEKLVGNSSTAYWLKQLVDAALVRTIDAPKDANGVAVKKYYPYTVDVAVQTLLDSQAPTDDKKDEQRGG